MISILLQKLYMPSVKLRFLCLNLPLSIDIKLCFFLLISKQFSKMHHLYLKLWHYYLNVTEKEALEYRALNFDLDTSSHYASWIKVHPRRIENSFHVCPDFIFAYFSIMWHIKEFTTITTFLLIRFSVFPLVVYLEIMCLYWLWKSRIFFNLLPSFRKWLLAF